MLICWWFCCFGRGARPMHILPATGWHQVENQKKTKGGFEMKRKSFIGAVVLGALLVVFAGISQAGGVIHKSSGDESPAVKTTSQEFSFADFGEGGPPMEYCGAWGGGCMASEVERT